MVFSSSSVFDNLPERPPTPPRDVSKDVDDAISFLDDSNEIDRALKVVLPHKTSFRSSTPITSPAPKECSASGNATKKVDFTPTPTYHPIARTGQLSSPSAQLRKKAPSDRDARPTRSILKQSSHPPPLTPDDLEIRVAYFSPQVPGSFAKMLQSVIQQLAGPSVSSRLDAYLALNGALQAYETVPDVRAMVAKMSVLLQFITRDLAWKGDNGALDVNMATQAFKLTANIMSDATLSAGLDDDFQTFLLDRSLAVIEQADMPKALIKNHMYLLAHQRFRTPAMTTSRGDRILTALLTVEERCTGNNVVTTRLIVYQRLLERVPAVMHQRMREWLEHVIHGMLSTIKDVRIRAIETCTKAGLILGTQPLAAKCVIELFAVEVEAGQTFYDYVEAQLRQMVSDKELGAYVPQIWSSITLLFRSKRSPIDKWARLKVWLGIVQRCLNASDILIRYQGYLAWNKFVFAVMPDASTSSSMLRMLKVPIESGLDRRGKYVHAKQIHQYALESFYNVLHYVLRPGLTYQELDTAWDDVVTPMLGYMIARKDKGQRLACSIVHGVCTTSSGTWNVDAAMEASPILPKDLPKLDPKWVRTRLGKILQLMEPVLRASYWSSGYNSAAINSTWHALMLSVAEAGRQEIKTSPDLKEAIALLVNLCRFPWSQPPAEVNASELRFDLPQYTAVVKVMVESIGPSAFSEDILLRTREDEIKVASTPSHRHSKHHATPQSPLLVLFGALYDSGLRIDHDEQLRDLAAALLELSVSSRSQPQTKIELLARSMQNWSKDFATNADRARNAFLWQSISSCATDTLQLPHMTNDSSQTVGLELRHGLTILTEGFHHAGFAFCIEASIEQLYDAMIPIARTTAGAAGIVSAVLEPLARILPEHLSAIPAAARLRLTSRLLVSAPWPRSRQELDQAKKSLWGVGPAPHKATSFDPYEHFYAILADALIYGYDTLCQDVPFLDTHNMISEALSFLKRCPLPLLAAAIGKVQDGFCRWLVDIDRKTGDSKEVINMLPDTARELIGLICAVPSHDSTLIQVLEPLLVALFSCPHKAVVNKTIDFWNQTFGMQEELRYPDRVAQVLDARRAEAELFLPTFPELTPDVTTFPLQPFYESQPDQSTGSFPAIGPVPQPTWPTSITSLEPTRALSGSGARVSKTPNPTPKARLRHDDSQIVFAPVEQADTTGVAVSQLTNRQQEIKTRQLETAQMFSNMSSSPITIARTTNDGAPQRLDFATRSREVLTGTPERLPNSDGLLSDDLPSSPTPSSNKDTVYTQSVIVAYELNAEADLDPPSSPPGSADEHLDMTASKMGEQDLESGAEDDIQAVPNSAPADLEPADNPIDSDLPSDTLLPGQQLLFEADQAADDVTEPKRVDETTIGTTFVNTEAEHSSLMSYHTQEPIILDDGHFTVADITRVEDSFVEAPPSDELEASHEKDVLAATSERTNKKRKRSSNKGSASKKRKQQSKSPLGAITGFFKTWVSSQPEEDTDIEDEIVVASSQPPSSPPQPNEPVKAPSPVVEIPVTSATRPSGNRHRGRPTKSVTPTPVPGTSRDWRQRSLKRKASDVEDSSAAETTTSVIEATPAPGQGRKQREGTDMKLVKAARLSQNQSDVRRSTRRTVAVAGEGVDVEEPVEFALSAHNQEEDDITSIERLIATPRSVLKHLRSILAVLPGMNFTALQEREADDLLYETRRAVHDAGRRGRD
ncbi:hypothetical protein LTR78_006238 [Recurvomyces mirabilis]|uniref:Telomere-associated protein Rif1 N-terminal domain-containing protein n=1 Tax=Recurvomyces mirabilis TaxID=574656 RepID=A0AAE1C0N4_9PEZI|nr:hypothetical protein LTR78_006238 [Recurvomyces mirabilis]KAK5152079.1 hypothetical protein LTS14_008854 [Recurvomyces mirabilis]